MDDPRDELAYDIWKIYNKFLGEGFNASRKQDRLHFMDWLLPARPPAPPNPAPKVPNYVLVWLPEYRKNHRIEVDPKEYVERPRPHEIKLYDSGLSWEEVYNVVFEWVAEQKAESDFRRRQEEEQKKAQRDADCHQEDVGDGSDEEDDDMNDEEDDDMNDEEDDGTSDEEDDVTSEEEEDDDMSEEEEDDDTDEEGEENKSREAEDLAGEGADDEDPSSSQPFDDHEAINEAKDEGDVDQSQDVSANTGEDVDEQNEDPSELFADNEWVDEVMNHDKEANDGTIHGTSDEEGSIDEEVKDATSNLRSNEEVEEGDSLQKSGGTAGLANGDDGDDDDFEGPMYGPISAWDDEGEL
ncbi:hypothetical protein BU26DRAFT_519633 [Trematosphaeria pertusa]|uniref:Uncharacterized protein n=1 Tax=Trematosphaeria pertusa TaxID=390896 RepID=A0A6A6IE14_9PLEO|nr:uncharacterized protein BU26DRAFT_519633 [Trematosphaeria pertusa]KAF2247810.1 hypothetical protein BU26DRAFT_519633 [Trematosphaeria pertusa]